MIDWRSMIHGSVTGWWWLLLHFTRFRRVLAENVGIRSVTPTGISRWHRGARYFSAIKISGERVFIKTDGMYRLLRNEVSAWERLQGGGSTDGVVPIRDYALQPPFGFAAFAWVQGCSLAEMPGSFWNRTNIQTLSDCLVRQLDALYHVGIVHRDFSPSNLLVIEHGGVLEKIYIIDFAFAVWANAPISACELPLSLFQDLAFGYKSESLVWDDAYACVQIMKRLTPPGLNEEGSTALQQRVGRLTYRYLANPAA